MKAIEEIIEKIELEISPDWCQIRIFKFKNAATASSKNVSMKILIKKEKKRKVLR